MTYDPQLLDQLARVFAAAALEEFVRAFEINGRGPDSQEAGEGGRTE